MFAPIEKPLAKLLDDCFADVAPNVPRPASPRFIGQPEYMGNRLDPWKLPLLDYLDQHLNVLADHADPFVFTSSLKVS